MTTKELLQQSYYVNQELEMRLEQITRLQELATRTTTTLGQGVKGGEKGKGSKIERALMAIEEQISRLADEITELMEINAEVAKTITAVKNPVEQKLLRYRYMCFFSWKQISALMKLSVRQLHRLHMEAIKKI